MSSFTLSVWSHPGSPLVFLLLLLFKVVVHQAIYNAFVSIILISPRPGSSLVFPLSFDFALLSGVRRTRSMNYVKTFTRKKEAAPAQIKYTKR